MNGALVLFPLVFGLALGLLAWVASTPRIRKGIDTYVERRHDGRFYVGTAGDPPGDWKYRMDRTDLVALRDQLNAVLEEATP